MISTKKPMFATYNCCSVRFDCTDAVFSFYFRCQALFHSKDEFAAAVRKETEALRQQVRHIYRQIQQYQRDSTLFQQLPLQPSYKFEKCLQAVRYLELVSFHMVIPSDPNSHVRMSQSSVISWITAITFFVQSQMAVESSIFILIISSVQQNS